MKIRITALAIDDRDGTQPFAFVDDDAAMEHMWRYAFDNSRDEFADIDALKAAYRGDILDAVEDNRRDNLTWTYGDADIEITPPTNPVAAARMAVEALALARDCLKVAEAPRALERVRAALSSAKGAVRNVENKRG